MEKLWEDKYLFQDAKKGKKDDEDKLMENEEDAEAAAAAKPATEYLGKLQWVN